jgi:hypothetical protein
MTQPIAFTPIFAMLAATAKQETVLAAAPQLDRLMLFGFVCMMVMLLCLMERHRSTSFVLGLAISSTAMAAYAFILGAWPVAFVHVAWSASTFRQWLRQANIIDRRHRLELRSMRSTPPEPWCGESRLTRLFGRSRFDN